MTKNARILFALWLIVGGSVGSPTPCAANTAVTLKPEVNIKRFAVKLSDLFTGVPSAIDRDIAQAPPACKPAIYEQQVLNKLADTYRLDWQPQNGADHAIVSSPCARITSDMIRDAVMAKLKADSNTRERSFEIAFDTRGLEVDLASDQTPDFTLENFSYDPTNKHFRADLTAQSPRGTTTVPVSGHVGIKRSVPILAHRLESGTTIGEADLDWLQVPEERITADVVTEASQLVGRELRRDTAEGDMIRSHDVVSPRLVTRGSLVTMKIETPFITVTSQGKSEQDGAQGDVVRVMNTQSNRVVEGTVTAPGTVEIHTAQKLAALGQ
jgi:flagella basal body P-ring formation protein FlgA